jgi:hypothetical protein
MAATRRSSCCSSPTGACAGCCAECTNWARRHGSIPASLHELRIGIKRLRYAIEFFGPMIPGKSGVIVIKRLAGLQEELGQLNDLASAGNLLMVCAGRDPHLREAVTLVGGWHGPRHAACSPTSPTSWRGSPASSCRDWTRSMHNAHATMSGPA